MVFSHLKIWKVIVLTLSLAITYGAIEAILILTLRVSQRSNLQIRSDASHRSHTREAFSGQ
jgi:hypothetical protein